MDTMRREFVYTTQGPQRPFLLPDGGHVHFELDVGAGGQGRVDITYDPAELVGRGKARWQPYDGGHAGGIYNVVALRAVIMRAHGWATLRMTGTK